MGKRLLALCAILILFGTVGVQAQTPCVWLRERINVFWRTHPNPPNERLIEEMEFTIRFEPPSAESGYIETELYLSDECPGCQATLVCLEPGIRLANLGWPVEQQTYIFLNVIEQNWQGDYHWLVFHQSVGWWRRHHQFRFWIKKDNSGNTFQYKVWDCDNGQELLISGTAQLQTTSYSGRIEAINATSEWSCPVMDYLAVWEGHWVKEASGAAYRWDRHSWLTDGEIDEEHTFANELRVGPVLHLYDDHPCACTGGYYWPTVLSGEADDGEPTFKSEVVGAEDFRSTAFSREELEEMYSAKANRVVIAPRATTYAKETYLPHVLDELEGQAHWNRVDLWHLNYY